VIAALLLLAAEAHAPSIVEVDEAAFALRRAAVYELRVEGIEARVTETVTRSLVAELRKRERLLIVDLEDIKAALDVEAERQALGCDDDDAGCLVELSDALGVDEILVGSITPVGEQRVFALRRVDRKKGAAVKSASRHLVPRGGEELLAAVGPLVEELYGDFPLREGETAGVPKELALQLNPPPIPAVATWSTLGAGGAVALLAGGAAVWSALEYGAAAELTSASRDETIPAALATQRYDNAVSAGYVAQGLGVAAGLLVVAGGIMLPFTNFTPE
jgi:hypothetical protein